MPNHYEILGVSKNAKESEIRTAYRKLVLKHHPDRSKDPSSAALFIRIQEAYEVLREPNRRHAYDQSIEPLRVQKPAPPEPAAIPRRNPTPAPAPRAKPKPPVEDAVVRMNDAFRKGRFAEAESLAKSILDLQPRSAAPYVVLADIARNSGDLSRACRMLAYAVQMEPSNPVYQRKYEEMLGEATRQAMQEIADTPDRAKRSAWIATFLAIACCLYMAIAHERAILPGLGLISSWSLGAVIMLYLGGVSLGAALSSGRLLDPFRLTALNSTGGLSPVVAMALVSIVNFWAAVGLYAFAGLSNNSLNKSATRLITAIGGFVLMATFAASLSPSLAPSQVFTWGGNLAYMGALSGWIVADAFREA